MVTLPDKAVGSSGSLVGIEKLHKSPPGAFYSEFHAPKSVFSMVSRPGHKILRKIFPEILREHREIGNPFFSEFEAYCACSEIKPKICFHLKWILDRFQSDFGCKLHGIRKLTIGGIF